MKKTFLFLTLLLLSISCEGICSNKNLISHTETSIIASTVIRENEPSIISKTTSKTEDPAIQILSTKKISIQSIRGVKTRLPANIYNAFVSLKFKIKIKNNVGYNGVFSIRRHTIILKRNNSTIFLHEMGHFTAALAHSADHNRNFRKIYKAERSRYHGRNRAYVIRNPYEYFAESFREYCTNRASLKRKRPKTYAYIKSSIASIDDYDIEDFRGSYSWMW